MKTRVIGLGNSILTDDGVGMAVVTELQKLPTGEGPDAVRSQAAGLELLELMSGWDRVILVDAIKFDDLEPGTIVRIDPADLRTSLRLRSVHEIDLPTALAFGRTLNIPMPGEVMVVGIQADDTLTFGETLTPALAEAVAPAVDLVLQLSKGDQA